MTMPHLMNCAHMSDGWCLDCVVKQHNTSEQRRAMLQEVGRWDCHGRSVAEQYDVKHGAGSWRHAVRFGPKPAKE
jgi:hypothetical protein